MKRAVVFIILWIAAVLVLIVTFLGATQIK